MTTDIADLSELTASWPGTKALAIANDDVLGSAGDIEWSTRIASISKLFTCYAALIAIEEGTISLSDAAGPPGSTVQHLMAHASGLGFESSGDRLFEPGTRRIYSNIGIEALADHLEQSAGISFIDYLTEAVIQPLGLVGFDPSGSPAHGMKASVSHLVRFGQELLTPTLLAPETMAQATLPVFADLRGVLPGYGSHDPNPWGLGFEIRGHKSPHWTAADHHPSTFGHFGGAGSFLWVDPTRRLIGASVSTEVFGKWAIDAWPVANDALLARFS